MNPSESQINNRRVDHDTPYSVVPLGPKPQIVSCPHCHYYVTTEINIVPSIKTHLKAVGLCICCLCFIPYICPICMNVDHFCPECENYIGTYIN
ncbi:PREDICTED: lipopolysaccharide-induced tumor necrosis factor-alpha factor-like [Nicrophorus vespilloides]|uniref:Lipopolysaccharide-induced tumor necrosis factor-alpha factor-like n=1 Tax=Nicrophorus vespilloides TaxID=110193 RepID=A0ABM1MNQ0_NICVS|nr:PREDICTED: lipopolysaccharide-induced tumor necrosis factor-alpha factor-like [Nicrophorus vespilloides]